MRIIGGRDYFDSALAYGIDETLVFVRSPRKSAALKPYAEAALKPLAGLWLSVEPAGRRRGGFGGRNKINVGYMSYEFSLSAVWFAGRRYGGVHVEALDTSRLSQDARRSLWFWDLDRFAGFLDEEGVALRKPDRWRENAVDRSNVADHFGREPEAAEARWLAENRVAIAVWENSVSFAPHSGRWKRNTGWRINCDGLGDVGFASRLDPYAAFQELSMYVGGVLPRSPNPTVEIEDEKTKVAKHGMDEWSFRRPPGGK